MKGNISTIAATAVLVAQPMQPLRAQTRPAEPIQTLPAPVNPPAVTLPGRPPQTQRPVPLATTRSPAARRR